MREVLRDTMFAATVTGSPVENACRLIHRYETRGRGYYAGALAVFGRDADGVVTMDSPIVIRTADVDLEGNLVVTAGATLVRDSDPHHETAETHAKANGILSAFGLVEPAGAPSHSVADLARDDDVLLALNARNRRLSSFWLTDQAGTAPDPRLRGLRVGILDGEDDFVNMLQHQLGVLGMTSEVIRHEDYTDGDLDDAVRLATAATRLAPLSQSGSKIGLDARTDDDHARYREAFATAWASEDLAEGQRAFAERRPPTFRGR